MDKGVNVIQLETASGAAIQSFEGAQGDYFLQNGKQEFSHTEFRRRYLAAFIFVKSSL